MNRLLSLGVASLLFVSQSIWMSKLTQASAEGDNIQAVASALEEMGQTLQSISDEEGILVAHESVKGLAEKGRAELEDKTAVWVASLSSSQVDSHLKTLALELQDESLLMVIYNRSLSAKEKLTKVLKQSFAPALGSESIEELIKTADIKGYEKTFSDFSDEVRSRGFDWKGLMWNILGVAIIIAIIVYVPYGFFILLVLALILPSYSD